MEPTQERIAALEHAMQKLHGRQSKVEQQLRRWRGLAGVLLVGSLLLQPLRVGKAASGSELGLAARMTALEQVFYYRPPRVRRVTPRTTPTLSVRVTALERAVNYQENQIAALGAALNQEIAARQATDSKPEAVPIANFRPTGDVAVYLPAAKVLFLGDRFQNAYYPRFGMGSQSRDIRGWIEGLRQLAADKHGLSLKKGACG